MCRLIPYTVVVQATVRTGNKFRVKIKSSINTFKN